MSKDTVEFIDVLERFAGIVQIPCGHAQHEARANDWQGLGNDR